MPPIKGLKASAVGTVTFDVTRNASGSITSGEVVFSFNYSFPGAVQVSGLHIHKGDKGAIGGIEVGAALSAADSALDADGHGNVTSVVTGDPAKLQAILDDPRAYYVNLHTTTPSHPGGAIRPTAQPDEALSARTYGAGDTRPRRCRGRSGGVARG